MSKARPDTPEAAALRGSIDESIESYRAFLSSPAFAHAIDLMVLVKIAGDETADIRERRRCAEVLAKLRLQAMEGLANNLGVREQSLDTLGLKSSGAPVALTQINQKIEIVRTSDWRSAGPLVEGDDAGGHGDDDVVVDALPESTGAAPDAHAAPALESPGQTEQVDGEDPPA